MAYIKICDLCGRQMMFAESTRQFKVKELKGSWEDHWWRRVDAHEVCIRGLMEEIHKKGERKK